MRIRAFPVSTGPRPGRAAAPGPGLRLPAGPAASPPCQPRRVPGAAGRRAGPAPGRAGLGPRRGRRGRAVRGELSAGRRPRAPPCELPGVGGGGERGEAASRGSGAPARGRWRNWSPRLSSPSSVKQINYENPRTALAGGVRGGGGAGFFVFKEKASKKESKVIRLHQQN